MGFRNWNAGIGNGWLCADVGHAVPDAVIFQYVDYNCGEYWALLLAGSLYRADVIRNGSFQLVQTGELLFFPQKVQQFDPAELPV